jgi:hypothetical protein
MYSTKMTASARSSSFQAPNRFKTHILDGTPDDPRVKTAQGDVTEILNRQLVGAKNILGTLRWLSPGENFQS